MRVNHVVAILLIIFFFCQSALLSATTSVLHIYIFIYLDRGILAVEKHIVFCLFLFWLAISNPNRLIHRYIQRDTCQISWNWDTTEAWCAPRPSSIETTNEVNRKNIKWSREKPFISLFKCPNYRYAFKCIVLFLLFIS